LPAAAAAAEEVEAKANVVFSSALALCFMVTRFGERAREKKRRERERVRRGFFRLFFFFVPFLVRRERNRDVKIFSLGLFPSP